VHFDNNKITVISKQGVGVSIDIAKLDPKTTGLWLWDIFMPVGNCSINFTADPKEMSLFHGGAETGCNKDDQALVDALLALRETGKQVYMAVEVEGKLLFASIARAYRSLPQKPLPGEDVRRLSVQAEDALAHKQFADAANLYTQAVQIAPWWADGYFNAALILGELGQYHQAITDMNHFLALDPDSPKARAAQDKVYVWERNDTTTPGPDPATEFQKAYADGKAKLGLMMLPVPPIVAAAHQQPNPEGALVLLVAQGSPAEAGGVLADDIVLSVAGKPVNAPADLKDIVAAIPAGSGPVQMVVNRNGAETVLTPQF
jgi:hypothetical protein